MGQKLKELRDMILADITKDYLDTASDEFLSETELAGLERDADDLFAEAFRQRDFRTTEVMQDLQEQIKRARQGVLPDSKEKLQQLSKGLQALSRHSAEGSTRFSWYRNLDARLSRYGKRFQPEPLSDNLDKGSSEAIKDYTSFFDNIENPADTQYDDVFPGEISPQALKVYKERALYALKKGRALLNNKALLRRLDSLRMQTQSDTDNLEYCSVGKVDADFPWAEKGKEGKKRENNIRTCKPKYPMGYSVFLHSHPNNLPLSLNEYDTAGDIKHSQVGNKNVFVITRDGDIYFTEPGLASFDYSPNVLPYSGYRQVYLGNIKDLLP